MRPLSKGRDLLLYGHPLRRLAPLRCRQGCPCLFRLAARPIDLAEQMALVRGHAIGCATAFRGGLAQLVVVPAPLRVALLHEPRRTGSGTPPAHSAGPATPRRAPSLANQASSIGLTIQTFRGLPNQDRFTRSLSP